MHNKDKKRRKTEFQMFLEPGPKQVLKWKFKAVNIAEAAEVHQFKSPSGDGSNIALQE